LGVPPAGRGGLIILKIRSFPRTGQSQFQREIDSKESGGGKGKRFLEKGTMREGQFAAVLENDDPRLSGEREGNPDG